jgi:signal transduction histidine kinase
LVGRNTVESWHAAAGANLVVGIAYLAISFAVAKPLIKMGTLRSNPFGATTAAIFLTCAVHHGILFVQMTLPSVGLGENSGLAMREALFWYQATWDVLAASVGIWYWALRKNYAPLMRRAKLFEDMKDRQRQALEINDNIVQGLTVAQLALTLEENERSREALEETLVRARHIISDLLGSVDDPEVKLGAGDLVRKRPATVTKGFPS